MISRVCCWWFVAGVISGYLFLPFMPWVKKRKPKANVVAMPLVKKGVMAMCDVCHGYGVGCEVCRGRGVFMVEAPPPGAPYV